MAKGKHAPSKGAVRHDKVLHPTSRKVQKMAKKETHRYVGFRVIMNNTIMYEGQMWNPRVKLVSSDSPPLQRSLFGSETIFLGFWGRKKTSQRVRSKYELS